MKWWVWIVIFMMTAFIVNYTTESTHEHEEAQNQVEIDLVLSDAIYPVEVVPVVAIVEHNKPEDHSFDYQTPATFLVGTDIPTGEYFVMSGEKEFGYVLLTRSRHLDVHEIIWQKHFENHTMISLLEGEYLTTKNATLIPIDEAIVPNFENGILRSGTYRIGEDIPPGVYTLFPLESKTGYFETATSSHHFEAHAIQRRNFTEPITIALNIGDYFTLMRAEIRK